MDDDDHFTSVNPLTSLPPHNNNKKRQQLVNLIYTIENNRYNDYLSFKKAYKQ